MSTPGDPETRFRDRRIVFQSGVEGRSVYVPSHSPLGYHQVLTDPGAMPEVVLDGQLFLAAGASPGSSSAAVILVPGSLGVADSHLRHAEDLVDAGVSVLVLDSFGARSVTSTVADQTQYSFAASAYDVLAAWRLLAELPEIDPRRIGAQGHSRGGSAVLTAATRCFADAVLGADRGLCAVLAAYPWCGHQFLDPRVGSTKVLVLMGDRDDWCSPMQAQSQCHAINLSGGSARMRLVAGACHSFDRGSGIELVPDAKVSPAAPTAYLAGDGAFIHPLESAPDPKLLDRDLMVYALKAGYGRTGAHIGSHSPEEPRVFREQMVSFWEQC